MLTLTAQAGSEPSTLLILTAQAGAELSALLSHLACIATSHSRTQKLMNGGMPEIIWVPRRKGAACLAGNHRSSSAGIPAVAKRCGDTNPTIDETDAGRLLVTAVCQVHQREWALQHVLQDSAVGCEWDTARLCFQVLITLLDPCFGWMALVKPDVCKPSSCSLHDGMMLFGSWGV